MLDGQPVCQQGADQPQNCLALPKAFSGPLQAPVVAASVPRRRPRAAELPVQPLHKLAEALKIALLKDLPGAEIDVDDGGDAAALSFEHPGHGATCLAFFEPDPQAAVALTLAVIVADAAQFAGAEALIGLLSLNVRLMTCAVGVMPINQDEMAVVLCRRVPAAAMEPGDAAGLYNDMIWEWAQLSQQLAHAAEAPAGSPAPSPVSTIAQPPRPRLIGSLDEL